MYQNKALSGADPVSLYGRHNTEGARGDTPTHHKEIVRVNGILDFRFKCKMVQYEPQSTGTFGNFWDN